MVWHWSATVSLPELHSSRSCPLEEPEKPINPSKQRGTASFYITNYINGSHYPHPTERPHSSCQQHLFASKGANGNRYPSSWQWYYVPIVLARLLDEPPWSAR